MELYDVMRTTGAVRRFTDAPLPDDVLERILDNARFAPTGGNRQGTHVIVIRDDKTRKALADLSVTGARRYTAQVKNGEYPWNPTKPMKVTPEEVAATEAGPYLPFMYCGAVLVICVDLNVCAAFDQHLDRIGLIAGAFAGPGFVLRLWLPAVLVTLLVLRFLYPRCVTAPPLSTAPDDVRAELDWMGVLAALAIVLTLAAVLANRWIEDALTGFSVAAVLLVVVG